jgi:uncharacterized membrane protein
MVINDELLIFLISASPVVELRGAIPLGMAKGMDLGTVLMFSFLGNLLPVIPLLFFLRWMTIRLEKIKGLGKLLDWWFKKVEKKSKVVEKYGFWGLVLFVSVPFPGTGAWTGSAAATLLNFKVWRAFCAIVLGVILAAVYVTTIYYVTVGALGLIKLWCIFI